MKSSSRLRSQATRTEEHLDVVIVDDDERYRMTMCRGIEAAGYLAGGAKDALTACSLIPLDRPGLAVIDTDIAGKDALWLASRFTSLNPHLQVVFTAGDPDSLKLIKQSSLPSLGLLLKPLDHTDILAILQTVAFKRPCDTYPALMSNHA